MVELLNAGHDVVVWIISPTVKRILRRVRTITGRILFLQDDLRDRNALTDISAKIR
jgi:hypothetical protein